MVGKNTTQQSKLKVELHGLYYKLGVISGAPEGKAVRSVIDPRVQMMKHIYLYILTLVLQYFNVTANAINC